MEFSNHPINHILNLKSKLDIPDNAILNFSIHKYSYQEKINLRKEFKLNIEDLSFQWLNSQLNSLEEGWEISFHSNIQFPNNHTLFLPLIDFNIDHISYNIREDILYRIERNETLIKYKEVICSMLIYASGRSFHGYGDCLLTSKDWIEFTTSLLLLNYTQGLKKTNIIVDTRWVAHRLLAKYTCLRWSKNTNKFLKYPSVMGKILMN